MRRNLVMLMAVLVVGPMLALGGCAQRTIHITSEPAGALVFLNDEEVGRTPVSVPFTFYGTYDVRLQHEGYQPLWTEQEAKGSVWELPGPDLIGEAVGARYDLRWHFTLEPLGEVDPDLLIDRARQLRATVRE